MQRSPHVNNLCRWLRNLRGFVTSYIKKEQFEVTDDSELSKPTFFDSAWLRNLMTIEQLSRGNQRPSSKTDNTAYKRITSCQYKFLSEDVFPSFDPYVFLLSVTMWLLARDCVTLRPWQKDCAISKRHLRGQSGHVIGLFVPRDRKYSSLISYVPMCPTHYWWSKKYIGHVTEKRIISDLGYLNNSFISSSNSFFRVNS